MAHASFDPLLGDLGFGALTLAPDPSSGGWRMGIRALFYVICDGCGHRIGGYASSEENLKMELKKVTECPECQRSLCFEEDHWPK